jgi:hypothetical protein
MNLNNEWKILNLLVIMKNYNYCLEIITTFLVDEFILCD